MEGRDGGERRRGEVSGRTVVSLNTTKQGIEQHPPPPAMRQHAAHMRMAAGPPCMLSGDADGWTSGLSRAERSYGDAAASSSHTAVMGATR